MPAIATRITAKEFMRMPDPIDGSQQELDCGEIITMPPPGFTHGMICAMITSLISQFVFRNKLGWVTCNDSGVILNRNPDTVRGPDVAYWSIKRLKKRPEGYPSIPPDLVVEVVSPSDSKKQLRRKIRQYVEAGVALVWVVDPEARTVTIYAGSMRGLELDDTEEIDGGTVLPGFRTKISEFLSE